MRAQNLRAKLFLPRTKTIGGDTVSAPSWHGIDFITHIVVMMIRSIPLEVSPGFEPTTSEFFEIGRAHV